MSKIGQNGLCDFIHVVNDLKNINNMKIKFELCKDNYVGYFIINNERICNNLWFNKKLRIDHGNEIILSNSKLKFIKKSEDKILLIVLESPHKDEFKKLKCNIAPAPALGTTGDNLDNYFINNIKGHIPNGKYHVILSNAIQWQCSLGDDPDKFRDRIWLKLWLQKGFNQNFSERLKKYNPDVIVNLCTKGSHKQDKSALKRAKTVINRKYLENIICEAQIDKIFVKNNKITLHELVQQKINEYSKNKCIKCIEGKHPSSWYIKKNQKMI